MTMSTNPSEKTVPAKCAQCSATIEGTVICDFCHALNPAATRMDHFSLLGLDQRYDIDPVELRKKYLALSRHAHPDFHMDDSQEVQKLHDQVAANVNDAYQTLLDPASRAAYLLELLGGKSSAADKTVPDGFLGTMMMMQEDVQEARETGHIDGLTHLRSVLSTQRDGLLKRIAELFADYQEAVACRAVTDDLMADIRKQLNAVSYVKKLLSQAE